MISHELGLIVPEIPKCGSSAMYAHLLSKDSTLDRKDHAALIEYRNYIKPGIDYTARFLGRNPYTRAVSAFEYGKRHDNHSSLNGVTLLDDDVTFQMWYNAIQYQDLFRDHGTEGMYFEGKEEGLTGCFRTQTSFINYIDDSRSFNSERCDDLLKKHEFIRLEEWGKDKSVVNSHRNTNEGRRYELKHWNLYYTDMEIVKQIELLYKDDFILWGYDPKINPYTEEPWQ